MVQLRERNTGSVVNVPEEKVGNVLALGYYERVESKPAKKSTSKSNK
jgi:hypothetical protein